MRALFVLRVCRMYNTATCAGFVSRVVYILYTYVYIHTCRLFVLRVVCKYMMYLCVYTYARAVYVARVSYV